MRELLQISAALSQPFMIDISFASASISLAEAFLSGNFPKVDRKPLLLSAYHPEQAGVYQLPAYDTGEDVLSSIEQDSTVIIPIQGSLMKHDYCGDFGMMTLAGLIRQAADNTNVSSIVLHVESPGGSADGSLDLSTAIAYAASKKTVVAYIDGIGASAAYRAAAAASYIVAKPQSIIGSIGTQWTIRNYDKQLENAGIQEITATADGSPDKNKDIIEAKAGNLTLIKESTLNPMNEAFVNEVKGFRKNVSDEALTGKVYDSASAKKLGLIDSEGFLADAIEASRNISSSKSRSNMKVKLPTALAQFFGFGDAEQEIQQEHVNQMDALVLENQQLKQDLEQKQSILDGLSAEKNTLANQVEELTASVNALTAEKIALEQKVEEYGALPGALGTHVPKPADDFKEDTPTGYVPEAAQKHVKQFSHKKS